MPYRHPTTPEHRPPSSPAWEKLRIVTFAALSPWLVPALILKDAAGFLRLCTLPGPLDAEGLVTLLSRLERDTPAGVTHHVRVVSGMASGPEDVWRVVAVRFPDGTDRVVSSFVGAPADDAGQRVLSAIRARSSATKVDEIDLVSPLGLPVVFSLLPVALSAASLALLVSPRASLLALAPLPISLALSALARTLARHVVPRPRP